MSAVTNIYIILICINISEFDLYLNVTSTKWVNTYYVGWVLLPCCIPGRINTTFIFISPGSHIHLELIKTKNTQSYVVGVRHFESNWNIKISTKISHIQSFAFQCDYIHRICTEQPIISYTGWQYTKWDSVVQHDKNDLLDLRAAVGFLYGVFVLIINQQSRIRGTGCKDAAKIEKCHVISSVVAWGRGSNNLIEVIYVDGEEIKSS